MSPLWDKWKDRVSTLGADEASFVTSTRGGIGFFFFATFEIQMLQKFSKSLQHELCNILESFKILATWTLQHYSIFSKPLQHCFATITNVAKNNIEISFCRGRVWDLE